MESSRKPDIEDRLDGIEAALTSGHVAEITLRYLRRIERKLDAVLTQGEKMAHTQKEAADTLEAVAKQLTKIGTETTQLLKDVADLKTAAANSQITPELHAAIEKVSAQATTVDDLVPDAPTPV